MKGKELEQLCKQFPDFEFEFRFTDGDNGKFLNVRSFSISESCDVGHSDKVVILSGEEN